MKIRRADSICHLMVMVVVLALALQAAAPAHASHSTQLDISDSDTSVDDVGNTASAGYAVSITNAALSASASAQNALFEPGNYWSASGNADGVLLYYDWRLAIPAGDYPSVLYVVVRVYVHGSVPVSGVGSTARRIHSIFFGSGAVTVVTDAPAPPVSADMEFAAELAAPGTTFNNPATRLRRFSAAVESHASAAGEVAQASSSSIAVNVSCFVIPPNITWVADSDLFFLPA